MNEGKIKYPSVCPQHPIQRASLTKCKICKALYQRKLHRRRKRETKRETTPKPYGLIQLNWPAPEGV